MKTMLVRAKFCRLTAAGQLRLEERCASWQRLTEAMTFALGTRPGEV